MDLNQLLEMGARMGYEGGNLNIFVTEQQNILREERAAVRAHELEIAAMKTEEANRARNEAM